MKVLLFIGKTVRLVLLLAKFWLWTIPTRLNVIGIGLYFGLIYVIFGTVHVQEIKALLGNDTTAYLFGFIQPFALPMFVAFISAFALSRQASGKSSLEQALRFRNGQMSVKPDKEASRILRKTSYLDMLNSDDSDVFESARRGFSAQYGNKPPTKVFKDLMDEND